jgi:hypothetical protein
MNLVARIDGLTAIRTQVVILLQRTDLFERVQPHTIIHQIHKRKGSLDRQAVASLHFRPSPSDSRSNPRLRPLFFPKPQHDLR